MQVKSSPAVRTSASEMPLTGTGVALSLLVPFPSCPWLLLPQHCTVPPFTMAHVCLFPAAIAVAINGVADEPPVAGPPPVAGEPPVAGIPPVAETPPVADAPPAR